MTPYVSQCDVCMDFGLVEYSPVDDPSSLNYATTEPGRRRMVASLIRLVFSTRKPRPATNRLAHLPDLLTAGIADLPGSHLIGDWARVRLAKSRVVKVCRLRRFSEGVCRLKPRLPHERTSLAESRYPSLDLDTVQSP